ncbi:hypothetical protein [Streptomyces sp. HPF1205]|uniref:hypothetical protein n=1 Tax=Streptomyces sp. HPF1205 TaxID=2873262 RepID=UPI001CEC1DC9|nr:hypothetical protein [Streptomyces sp. HPF1205]
MVTISSRTLVTGLLAAALGTVGLLTVQAADSAGTAPAGTAGGTAGAGAAGLGAGRGAGPATGHGTTRLPAGSGTGERVVYSLSGGRVWLVGGHGEVVRSFAVVGGGLPPSVGPHKVFARRQGGRGGDGVKVEHVVLFAETDGLNIGFSAAADGSMAARDPAMRSGAVRESRADAAALWQRAPIGAAVVVVR